jgi:hypothetical protein
VSAPQERQPALVEDASPWLLAMFLLLFLAILALGLSA